MLEPFFCSCLLPSCLFLGVTLSTLDSRLGSSLQFTSWFDFGKVYVDVVGFVVNNNLLDFLLYVVDHKRKIVRTWNLVFQGLSFRRERAWMFVCCKDRRCEMKDATLVHMPPTIEDVMLAARFVFLSALLLRATC